MNFKEIKLAIASGKKVYWSSDGYQVIKGKYEWIIKCEMNGHITGLLNFEGKLTDNESQFFTLKTKTHA